MSHSRDREFLPARLNHYLNFFDTYVRANDQNARAIIGEQKAQQIEQAVENDALIEANQSYFAPPAA